MMVLRWMQSKSQYDFERASCDELLLLLLLLLYYDSCMQIEVSSCPFEINTRVEEVHFHGTQ